MNRPVSSDSTEPTADDREARPRDSARSPDVLRSTAGNDMQAGRNGSRESDDTRQDTV